MKMYRITIDEQTDFGYESDEYYVMAEDGHVAIAKAMDRWIADNKGKTIQRLTLSPEENVTFIDYKEET